MVHVLFAQRLCGYFPLTRELTKSSNHIIPFGIFVPTVKSKLPSFLAVWRWENKPTITAL